MPFWSERSHATVAVLIGMAVIAGLALAALPRIGISASPRTQFASRNAKVTIELRIRRHPDNRRIVLILACDGMEVQTAEFDHVGEDAHPLISRTYYRLEPCEYEAVAGLVTKDRETFVARTSFLVISPQ